MINRTLTTESLYTIILTSFLLFLTSCGFSRLTEIHDQDIEAPTAKECGSCHADQYAEWQKSSHARAYISREYRKQTDDYQEESCLFCHIPGDIQNPDQEVRRYNLEEGITCVSCHLHDGAMQGPHQSGALFTPHAIAQSPLHDAKRNSSKLCGICHQETYDQWQEQRQGDRFPPCLICHGAPVERRSSQGSGFFSDLLVSFEPVHQVRSHHMVLTSQSNKGVYPDLQVEWFDTNKISITLNNTLPHDLPAGSFGDKHIFAAISRTSLDCQGVCEADKIGHIDFADILPPGEKIEVTAVLPDMDHIDSLVIDLYRYHQSTNSADIIHSYIFSAHSHPARQP